jgi:hypothetical protein
MKKVITFAAAAVAVVSSALFAQDSITVDLSEMKGSPVAMVAEPITNTLVLYPYTNRVFSRSVLSVDGVVKQLREQGDMTNLVKKLVESGDVCAVIGHKWEYGCGMPGCLVIHNDPIRHCAVCGATQTQKVSEWK